MARANYFQDLFTDSDDTGLDTHVPDLGTYQGTSDFTSRDPDTLEIIGNKCECTLQAVGEITLTEVASEDDYSVEFEITIEDLPGAMSVYLRHNSLFTDGYYRMNIAGGLSQNFTVTLARIEGGTFAIGSTYDVTGNSFPLTHVMRWHCFSALHEVFVDDVLQISGIDDNVNGATHRKATIRISPAGTKDSYIMDDLVFFTGRDPVAGGGDRGLITDVTQDMIDTVTRSVAA